MKFDFEKSLDILARTPAVLTQLLRNAPTEFVQGNEGPETWSAFDVVGHLIEGEKTDWITRAKRILEHGEAHIFKPFDRFSHLEENKGKELNELLNYFTVLRAQNLKELKGMGLSPEDFDRRGTHPALGSVTLGELLATWTVHDLGHIAQITRAMAKQYADEVGPWKEYLPVLAPRK